MNIAEQAKTTTFEVIPTTQSQEGLTPVCVLCEKRIETEDCLVGKERDGFYLHPICGNNIGVRVK